MSFFKKLFGKKPEDINAELYEIFDAGSMIPEPFSSLTDDEKQRVDKLLTRFEKLKAEHDDLPRGKMIGAMLLSKAGRYKEALALTEEQYEQDPNWETAVNVANASRRSGDMERAAEFFAKGSEHDLEDMSCFLEVGDIRLEQGKWEDALTAYEKALSKDAEQPWALPSAFFCRHQLGMEGQWLQSLKELASQEGCTCGLEGCLTQVFGSGYGPSDSIARAEYLVEKLENKKDDQ